jgi:2'-5' RNA ligase
MRRASAYRYFLCFVPDAAVREAIAWLHQQTGQSGRRVPVERSHLSLCVFGAPPQRDSALAPRIDAALGGAGFAACVVRFGRVRGGPNGATLFTRGGIDGLTRLRRQILARLAACGTAPELEKRNPHVTLGYDPCRGPGFDIALEWVPRKIVLIESEHGLGKHNRLCSWPLLAPEQGMLPFGRPPSDLRR